jgi:hypothetical protein
MVEFVDILTGVNLSYHLDKKLKERWDKLKGGKLASINEDRVYLVDGRERTGKSSFVFQQAKYIDPTFNVDRICFRPEDFLNQIRTVPKGSVVVFDEAFRGLSSKSTRSKTNKAIVEAMMEVGQRNLIIFIVLPTIFLLEIYAAVFRSECLFHIYKLKSGSSDGVKHRAFKIYNYQKKKQLYLRGKTKYFSYSKPYISKAKGRFFLKRYTHPLYALPYETFEMDLYLKKKEQAFRESEKKEETEEDKYRIKYEQAITFIKKAFNKSERKTSEWLALGGLEVAPTQVGEITRKHPEIAPAPYT